MAKDKESKSKSFVTTHNGIFIDHGIEFKPGISVELTKEQQESVKGSIANGMLKAV